MDLMSFCLWKSAAFCKSSRDLLRSPFLIPKKWPKAKRFFPITGWLAFVCIHHVPGFIWQRQGCVVWALTTVYHNADDWSLYEQKHKARFLLWLHAWNRKMLYLIEKRDVVSRIPIIRFLYILLEWWLLKKTAAGQSSECSKFSNLKLCFWSVRAISFNTNMWVLFYSTGGDVDNVSHWWTGAHK